MYMKGQTFNMTNLSTKQKVDLINNDLRQNFGGESNCFVWTEPLIVEKTICEPDNTKHTFFAVKGIPASNISQGHRTKHIAIYNLTKHSLSLYESNPSEKQLYDPYYNFKPFETPHIKLQPDRIKSGTDINFYQGSKQQDGAIHNV